ncbi:MAG: hypothetical protein AABY22_30600, partial [Nanoarchaeota archaeon]
MPNFRYSEYYKKKARGMINKIEDPKKETKPLPVIPGPKESMLTEVKKKIEKDYNRNWNFLILPKYIKSLKFLIIILAVLLVFFILYKNFISAEEFNYFYDIGENENHLSPNYRISEKNSENSISYRNLTSNLVYFNVPIPRGSEKIKIDVKFKDNFNSTLILLGGKDREDWHYKWNTLYNKPIEEVTSSYQDEGYYIHKINPDLEEKRLLEIENSKNLIIASNVKLQKKINNIEFSKLPTIINTTLRGGHTFYIYTSGYLLIEVKKQDLNWYNGSDQLDIEVYDSGDNLLFTNTIPDDGITTISPNKNSANIQKGTIELENLPESVYRIEFRNFDGVIRQITTNTDKIVAANSLYLADSDLFFKNLEKNTGVVRFLISPS